MIMIWRGSSLSIVAYVYVPPLTWLAFFLLHFFLFISYALFDKDGRQVPQEIVTKVGEIFEQILKEVLQPFSFTYYLLIVSLNQL
jgi:hypothetical protein